MESIKMSHSLIFYESLCQLMLDLCHTLVPDPYYLQLLKSRVKFYVKEVYYKERMVHGPGVYLTKDMRHRIRQYLKANYLRLKERHDFEQSHQDFVQSLDAHLKHFLIMHFKHVSHPLMMSTLTKFRNKIIMQEQQFFAKTGIPPVWSDRRQKKLWFFVKQSLIVSPDSPPEQQE